MKDKSSFLAEIAKKSLLEVVPGLPQLVLEKGEIALYGAGELLSHQGDEITHLVMPVSHGVKLTYSTSGVGNDAFLGYLQKHRSIGLKEILSDGRYRYTSVAEAPTTALKLPKQDFLALIEARPDVRAYLQLVTSSSSARTLRSLLTERGIEYRGLFEIFSQISTTSRLFREGQVLPQDVPTLWLLQSGKVKVASKEGVDPWFSVLLGEGAWFGGEGLVSPYKTSYDLVAAEDAVLHGAPLAAIGPVLAKFKLTEAIYDEPWIYAGPRDVKTGTVTVLSTLPGRELKESEAILLSAELGVRIDARDLQSTQSDSRSSIASIANLATILNAKINLSGVENDLVSGGKISLLRIAEALEPFGLYARSVKTSLNRLNRQSLPALMKLGPRVVVALRASANGSDLFVLDPARGLVSLRAAEATAIWDGMILEVFLAQAAPELIEQGEKAKEAKLAKDTEDPTAERGKETRRNFVAMLMEYRPVLVSALLLSIGSLLLGLVLPLFSQAILDEVLTLKDTRLLWVYATGLAITVVLNMSVSIAKQLAMGEFTRVYDLKLSALFYRHAMSLSSKFYKDRKAGDALARLMEVQSIRGFLSGTSIQSVVDLLSLVVYSAVLTFYSYKVALCAVGLLVVAVLVRVLFRSKLRNDYSAAFDADSRAKSMVAEQITAIATIKATGAESILRRKWEAAMLQGVELRRRIQMTSTTVQGVLGFASSLTRLGGIWIACSIALRGELSPGKIMAVSMYLDRVISPINSLAGLLSSVEQVKVAFNKIGEVFGTEAEQSPKKAAVTHSILLKGKIKLERLGFRYGPDTPWVLRDVSLTIYPKQVIAIVGRSGCGKTTLANIIAGNLHPSSGRIFFDDFDSTFLSLNSLRRQIGFIMQSNDLFAGTIGDNIAYADDAPVQEDIEMAARDAHAADFIATFPTGYSQYLAEGGLGLSGGQKQRVSIARTLYRNPKVLIMDEATSALDAESEKAIVENMKEILKNKTAIVIAHRLSTIRSADRIIVMKDGEIVEEGIHGELLRAGGHYAELFESQVSAGDA